jgi:lysophospholipase L1-like esterase
VITLEIPNDEWRAPARTALGIGRDPADCGGDDNQQCLRDMIDTYKSNVDAIFKELTAIADPSKTLIRAQDFYMYLFPADQISQIYDILPSYWKEAQDYLGEVAAGYGIPVAKVYDDFMGPDGTKNPEQDGLISSDGLHPTVAGAQRISELIHDLGYGLAS